MGLAEQLKGQALSLGFELAGIAAARPADGFERLRDWLARGFAGNMAYMAKHEKARRHPESILPAVKSVLMVALNHGPVDAAPSSSTPETAPRRLHGKVARYARGADYHEVLRRKLKALLDSVRREVPGAQGRGVVDTAPLLERDFARRAGLGWFGKNTMLIHKKLGSYFLLGALLLDVELEPDEPFTAHHCGTCTACLDACPTHAFAAPGVLDARRCISYLTIELRSSIAEDLRAPMGDWVFGCDICQEVCPWNRKAPPGREPALQSRNDWAALDLMEIMGLSEEGFRTRFRGSALMRCKRGGLLRNAAIVLGNQGDPAALPVLEKACADADPLVREAAGWAIGRIREKASESRV